MKLLNSAEVYVIVLKGTTSFSQKVLGLSKEPGISIYRRCGLPRYSS